MIMITISSFEQWLHSRGYRMNTIRGFVKATELFFSWCDREHVDPATAAYSDLLAYINFCHSTENSKHTINLKLNTLRHFYNYCMSSGARTDNPVAELRIRNVVRTTVHGILSTEELEAVYHRYQATGITGKRNKAMLGLLVYQGITTAELSVLEVKDIRLEEGKIYVPVVGRGNSRVLSLQAHQVLQLQGYLMTVRPVLLSLSEKQTEKLFLSTGKSKRLSNSYARMLMNVRKVNPVVKDLKQIRASVITQWLKDHDIRVTQYMSGHRYISSTDRYRTDRLETLQEQLEHLHPLA